MDSCDPNLLSLIEDACTWQIGSMVLPLYTSLSDPEPIEVDIVKWMEGKKGKYFNNFKNVSSVLCTFVENVPKLLLKCVMWPEVMKCMVMCFLFI